MGKRHLIVILAVIAAATIVSCSQDTLMNPPRDSNTRMGGLSAPLDVVGPSEIAVCIDVSDSIGSDELASMVGALKGSLSNTAIVPQDGAVTVSAIVYGDTVAVSFPPTPVTADNLAYIKVATGIGSGHVIGGEIYRGATGVAGEIGHMAIDPQGKRSLFNDAGRPRPAIARLLEAGESVVGVDLLGQGEFTEDGEPVTQSRLVRPYEKGWRGYAGYTFGYNHPVFAQRVHDILSVVALLRRGLDGRVEGAGGECGRTSRSRPLGGRGPGLG